MGKLPEKPYLKTRRGSEMKIYKTQQEIEADVVDGVLKIKSDVKFEVSFSIDASIIVTGNINAWDINAWDINARNINAGDIIAGDINAGNINAWDINARNINAGDIIAGDINAGDISFFAVCFTYISFRCKSIVGRREKSKYFCLDSDVIVGHTK
jgi:hypothetical protein